MLVSAALVLLMTGPGLALFYGGLVRKKNILGTMMQSFAMMGLVTILWAVVGYSLAFGHGNAFIGGFEHVFLRGVGLTPNTDYAATIPEQTYMIYQLMFAIITPALITGAFAERMKFSAMAVFLSLWSLLVYSPMAHMVWGVGGFLNATGGHVPSLDFAGGTVVHITSGVSALVTCIYLGKRIGYPHTNMPPHSAGHLGLHQYPLRRRGCRARMDHRRVDSQRQTHRPGRHLRSRRRPGRHHSRLRLRAALRGPGHRPDRRRLLLLHGL
jgi:Amt family ammonium transporter